MIRLRAAFMAFLIVATLPLSLANSPEEPVMKDVKHFSTTMDDPYGKGQWTFNLWIKQLVNDHDPDYDYYTFLTRTNWEGTNRKVQELHTHLYLTPYDTNDYADHPYLDEDLVSMDLDDGDGYSHKPWAPEAQDIDDWKLMDINLRAKFKIPYTPIEGDISTHIEIKFQKHVYFTPNRGWNNAKTIFSFYDSISGAPAFDTGDAGYEFAQWRWFVDYAMGFSDKEPVDGKRSESVAILKVPDAGNNEFAGKVGYQIAFADNCLGQFVIEYGAMYEKEAFEIRDFNGEASAEKEMLNKDLISLEIPEDYELEGDPGYVEYQTLEVPYQE